MAKKHVTMVLCFVLTTRETFPLSSIELWQHGGEDIDKNLQFGLPYQCTALSTASRVLATRHRQRPPGFVDMVGNINSKGFSKALHVLDTLRRNMPQTNL